MIKTTTTISNKLGLHARASAKLTKLAGSFPCEVWMMRGERRVNAKSIMGVMMLAAAKGIGHRYLVDFGLVQFLFYFVQLLGLYVRYDQFHCWFLLTCC